MAPRSDHKEFYSQFAHAAYGKWKAEFVAPEDYILVKQYSNDESQIYKNNKNVIMAIRGTKSYKNDLITDAFLAVDAIRATKRYKNEYKKCKTVIEELKKPVILVGHSLGGSLCIALNRDIDDGVGECHAYNPGASLLNLPTEVFEKIICKFFLKKKCKSRKRLYIHRQLLDPVSIVSDIISDNTTTDNNGIHSIESFLPTISGGIVEDEPGSSVDYSKMKKNELYHMLKEKGEKVNKTMKIAELLELLK